MKKKTIYKKITGVFLLMLLLFSSGISVFAATNPGYTTPVSSGNLNSSMKNSTLLDAIAKLVFGVAQLMEWLLGSIFTALTGIDDFPWADKIVFNAVPLLDVNFINPDINSFIGQTSVQKAIGNVYQTVFSMAVVAFGIIVLIMAIKLVLSSIASEKAKYKQSLVNWLTGLVMLFMIHFFMSFMFYLNETLVNACFKTAQTYMKDVNTNTMVKVADIGTEMKEKAAKNSDVTTANGTKVTDVLNNYPQALTAWLTLNLGDNDDGISESVDWKKEKTQLKLIGSILENAGSGKLDSTALNKTFKIDTTEEIKTYLTGTSSSTTYTLIYVNSDGKKTPVSTDMLRKWLGGNTNADYIIEQLKLNASNTLNVNYTNDPNNNGANLGSAIYAFTQSTDYTNLPLKLQQLRYMALNGSTVKNGTSTGSMLLSSLAQAFKLNAQELSLRGDYDVKAKSSGDIDIPNMLMYATLVGQSIILFVAYLKRLFYVLILALLSPMVVVLDFYQKTIRG